MSSCHCTPKPVTEFHDFYSENIYTWCTNCGNYGIHAAMKRALVATNSAPCNTLLCFDIGCNGNGSDKIDGYRFHGLHGRVIPLACGASVANSKVKVVAFGGDGGTLGEGVNHLVHAIRDNYNITFVLHNNLNYGLTLGQASPTTKYGIEMEASPEGVTSQPLHPMRFVLSLRPTFAARTFSGDVKHMTRIFEAGLTHPGFSFIEVLQSCPTYNKMTPHEWYQSRVTDVSMLDGYKADNYDRATEIAEDIENKIAIGVLYQDTQSVPFMKRRFVRKDSTTELVDEVHQVSTKKLFDTFR